MSKFKGLENFEQQSYKHIPTKLLSLLNKYTATQKKKCQNPRTRPYIPYVFEVADSEAVVHLTPSPPGQGQVKVKFTKLTETKV